MKHIFLLHAILFLIVGFRFIARTPDEPQCLTSLASPQTVNLADTRSPCSTFQEAENRDEVEANYVIYRQLMKAEQWEKAMDYWKKVYALAPAADGRRATIYLDGVRFYQHFYRLSKDSLEKERYIDGIFALYDDIQRCYPKSENIPARKAFDLYHKYPHRATSLEIFHLGQQALEVESTSVSSYFPELFTVLLRELYTSQEIKLEEARKYAVLIKEFTSNHQRKCQGYRDCDFWAQVSDQVRARLGFFETIRGFYPCEFYLNKYYSAFEKDSLNCAVIVTTYKKMIWGMCGDEESKFNRVLAAKEQNCLDFPSPKDTLAQLLRHLSSGRFKLAERLAEQLCVEKKLDHPKAASLMFIAKLYYHQFRHFTKAREYALKAAAHRKNWGDPFLLIGRLYAESDSLCSNDSDWVGGMAYFAAFDQWNYAKSIDVAVNEKADLWMEKHQQNLPTTEVIKSQGLQIGDTLQIGCWIQEKTRLRAAKK